MEVDRIMNRKLASLTLQATLLEAAKLMEKDEVGCVLVVDEKGKLVGILTDRDLVVRGIAKGRGPGDSTVESAMTPHPFTARANDEIMLVARRMADKGVRRLPIVDDNGKLVGLASVDDLLTIFVSELSNVAAAIVGSSKLLS